MSASAILHAQMMPLPVDTEPRAAAADVKLPVYEVASVKPHAGDDRMMRWGTNQDGFSAINLPLKLLIANCYDIRQDLISGGPAWVDTKRFDLEAKVDSADIATVKKLNFDQQRAMLKPVLAERFGLKVHKETKTLPVYELVVAKGGPKLKAAEPEPPPAPDQSPTPDAKPDDTHRPRGTFMTRPGEFDGTDLPISSLVSVLAGTLQRNVIDKTGLTAKYDFTLKYTPEENMPSGSDSGTTETAPSVFTALVEQLGLKLVPGKGPVETLVIDQVNLPTEN